MAAGDLVVTQPPAPNTRGLRATHHPIGQPARESKPRRLDRAWPAPSCNGSHRYRAGDRTLPQTPVGPSFGSDHVRLGRLWAVTARPPSVSDGQAGQDSEQRFPRSDGVWRLDRPDQWLKKIPADRCRPTNRHHLSPRLAAFRGRVAYLGGRGPRRGDRNCPRRLAVDWDGRRSKRASAVWLSSPSAHAPRSSAGTAPAMGRGMGRDRFGLHPRGREGGRRSGPDQSVSSGGLQAHIAAGVVPGTTASSTMSLRTLQLCRWPWVLATGRRQLASREQ
jgi:hypothetical protein